MGWAKFETIHEAQVREGRTLRWVPLSEIAALEDLHPLVAEALRSMKARGWIDY